MPIQLTERLIIRAAFWRLGLVLFAVAVALVGRYWASVAHRCFFVGDPNPSGTQFLSYNYSDAGPDFPTVPQIRDLKSGKLLHNLDDIGPAWGDSVAWINDETLVVLVEIDNAPETGSEALSATDSDKSGSYVATVRLDGDQKSVSKKWISDRHIQAILPSGEQHYVFAIGENSGPNRHLKVMRTPVDGLAGNALAGGEAPIELVRFDLGDREEAYANRPSATAPGTIVVTFIPSQQLGAKATETAETDFKFTDGINRITKILDASTGDVIRTITNAELVNQSDRYLWRDTATGLEIFQTDDLETPVEKLTSNNMGSLFPLDINDNQIYLVERLAKQHNLRIIDRKSRSEKEFTFPGRTSLNVVNGEIYIFSNYGSLLKKLDTVTGESQLIANARPYNSVARNVAWGGIPSLLLFASVVTLLSGRPMPFFDMGLACVLVAVAIFAWADINTTNPVEMLWLTQASLGAAIAVLLAWATTSRALFGWAIPVAIVAIAVIFSFYLFAWSERAGAMLEVVVGAPLLIFFQTLGHALFRRFVGTIHGPNVKADSRRQYSVQQIAVTVAAIAFLFACLRHAKLGESQGPRTVIVWIVAFAALYAACVTWAAWCAFQFKNVFASGLATWLGSLLYAATLFVATQQLSNLNIDGTAYAQPLVSAMVVWWTLRLCIRIGYQLS